MMLVTRLNYVYVRQMNENEIYACCLSCYDLSVIILRVCVRCALRTMTKTPEYSSAPEYIKKQNSFCI